MVTSLIFINFGVTLMGFFFWQSMITPAAYYDAKATSRHNKIQKQIFKSNSEMNSDLASF